MNTVVNEDKQFELWQAFHQTHILVTKARQKELKKYATTTAQAAALDCIHHSRNKANPNQISKWLLLEAQSVSTLLNRMERAGLIRRSQDPDKKNAIRVRMTRKGEELYSQIVKRESIHRMLNSLSSIESEQLMQSLKKLKSEACKLLSASLYHEFMKETDSNHQS